MRQNIVSAGFREAHTVERVLAGHTNSYHGYSLDDALAGIAAAGFRFVELAAVPGWTEHLSVGASEDDLIALESKLREYGLRASALSGHGSPEEALTEPAGVEHARRAIRLATRLAIPIVNTAIGGHAPDAQENEHAFLAHIGEIADEAEACGVTIGLEIHGALMASGQQSVDLLRHINRPSIGINYDTANVTYYSGLSAESDIKAALPFLVHVHLKDTAGGKGDWNFPALGRGHVPWTEVFNVLQQGGYGGPFSVELEFQGEPWPPLADIDAAMLESRRFLDRLFASRATE